MKESEIFIIGAKGQLGTALRLKYPGAMWADIDELDITSKPSVENFDWSNVKIILNAAAYTNVDGAETPEGRVLAWSVNADAVANLTSVAAKFDALIIHISTDYVFDGSIDLHKEDEAFSPLSTYGASKAAGDLVVSLAPKFYILRTSWVIGEGKNFVQTMLDLGKRGVNPSVVCDQIGRLTFTSQLVEAIDLLLKTGAPYGTYNVSNEGDSVSWAEIASETFRLANINNYVTPVSTAKYYEGKVGIAPRPLKSTLDLAKIKKLGLETKNWRNELKLYIDKELKK